MKKIIIRTAMLGVLLQAFILAGCGDGGSTAGTGNTSNPPAKTNDLSVPSEVTATSGINTIDLAWTPVPGAESYNVYWSVNPGVTPATGTRISVTGNSYRHDGLTVSRTYFYVVTAVNSSGESLSSGQVSTVSATNGANLYVTYCLGCHGPAADTKFVNGTSAGIKAAIAANSGGVMGGLPPLTSDQIDLISAQLPCH